MKFEFIGWFKEDEHDKVWGVIILKEGNSRYGDKTYATFWGRRGKKLQHKIFTGNTWEIDSLINTKTRKGYNRIDQAKLDEVYPEFQKDLQKTAVWAILKIPV